MSSSLKSQYAKWLWLVATADLIAILLLVPGVFSGINLTELGYWRLLVTPVIPVVVLLVVNILPSKVKCMLVYWKPYGWLPGCEVFTTYAPTDPRISMPSLAKNIGPIPVEPDEQNSRWYQLYKQIENEPEIAEAQKSFLLYRDVAALSLPFIVLAPLCLYFTGSSPKIQWIGAGIFFGQYLLTALSSNNTGVRFVTNVLAVHSARKVTTRARK